MTAFETMSDQSYLTRTKAQHPGGEKQESRAWLLQGHAERAAFLINGNRYFSEVARALRQARRTVWIIGWDFHPDIRIAPEKSDETLADLLHSAVATNPDLEIRILIWALGPIYSDKSIQLLRKKDFPKMPGLICASTFQAPCAAAIIRSSSALMMLSPSSAASI